ATGKWVTDGMVFYLQNVSGDLPRTAANTLATAAVHTTTNGCGPAIGSIVVTPQPVQACDAPGKGPATAAWSSAGPAAVEVHLNAPDGPLFSAAGLNGGQTTGVSDGTVFYLQNVSDELPLTAANTLATATAHTTTIGCGIPSGTIVALPDRVVVCDGTLLG